MDPLAPRQFVHRDGVFQIDAQRPFAQHGFAGVDRLADQFEMVRHFDRDDNEIHVGMADEILIGCDGMRDAEFLGRCFRRPRLAVADGCDLIVRTAAEGRGDGLSPPSPCPRERRRCRL